MDSLGLVGKEMTEVEWLAAMFVIEPVAHIAAEGTEFVENAACLRERVQ
ncbi:hypothetical protein C7410_14621 [Paraburkholderia silvatlantica]|uniref:Uncharacterized protein n=1 Tax=Paraburkholderia silvatlantica TaxID=321895 RepID=A0A2V4TI97_9BURK|nr:hypothetical protein [Paraburkholderia silvatlantica]PYE13417.1 hypothetical protein C7410_14621 [Paraburkholderia silvatlantica]